MKTHILRAPETDRKKVLVPNLLTDLDDYLSGTAHGLAETSADWAITGAGSWDPVYLDAATDLSFVTSDAIGLTVGVGGLYMLAATVRWLAIDHGAFTTPAADHTLRASRVEVNAASAVVLTNAPTDLGTDSGSIVVRLAAGDYATISASDTTGGTCEHYLLATLSVVKIAP